MDNPEKLATLGNRQTSGESASLDEGTESAEVATSVTSYIYNIFSLNGITYPT
jgi:hypothetical protein